VVILVVVFTGGGISASKMEDLVRASYQSAINVGCEPRGEQTYYCSISGSKGCEGAVLARYDPGNGSDDWEQVEGWGDYAQGSLSGCD